MTRYLRAAVLVMAAGLMAALGTPGMADDLVYRPETPAKKTQAPANKPAEIKTVSPPAAPEAETESVPECIVVSVRAAATKANGKAWDSSIRSDPEPDIVIVETGSGARAQCDGSFTCQVTVLPGREDVHLTIVDYDFLTNDETIGAGTCHYGTPCRLGLAQVDLSPC